MLLIAVISITFYLVTVLTINMVGSSLMTDTVRQQMNTVSGLSISLGERLGKDTADDFYAKLLEAARQNGGRLFVVDPDGKIIFDTYDETCGMLLPLSEGWSVLHNEQDHDYGFHYVRGLGTGTVFFGNAGTPMWIGCFATAIRSGEGKLEGVLISVAGVQDTLSAVDDLRNRLMSIFAVALIVVLGAALVITSILTRPIKELSAGIDRMAKGDYGQKVRVRGRDEMAQLAAGFNQMSEQVHNLDEARNQFVSNASHELRTPLTTMKILLESVIYQDDMDPGLQKEFLTDINKEIDRLSAVVSDLLTLVHIDSHKLKLRREDIYFGDIVNESAGRLAPMAVKKGVVLEVTIEDECEMTADAGKLGQVCYNIIGNAIKYTPEGGNVKVTLGRENRNAVLRVQDNGIGIPEDDLPHVFDRFYRVDKSRARTGDEGGTGLGLSIVRQIVRLHAGSVTVTSELGKGTLFTVLLPVITTTEVRT